MLTKQDNIRQNASLDILKHTHEYASHKNLFCVITARNQKEITYDDA